MFNVGDRIRCINTGGYVRNYLNSGEYIVASITPLGNLRLEGQPDDVAFGPDRFELVEAAATPVDNREEITIYVCIYTDSNLPDRKFSLTSLTEANANQQAEFLRNRNDFTLLAMKKFKTRI